MRPWMSADPQTIHVLLRLPEAPIVSFPRVSTRQEVDERIVMSPNSMAALQPGQRVFTACGDTPCVVPHRWQRTARFSEAGGAGEAGGNFEPAPGLTS
jgi:hypothetical protein